MTELPSPPWEDLRRQPTPLGAVYKWADLVEFNCLVHPNRALTFADVVALTDADADAALEAAYLLGKDADVDDTLAVKEFEDIADGEPDGVAEHGAEVDEGTTVPAESVLLGHRRARMRSRLRLVRPVDAAARDDKRDVLAADVFRVMRWRSAAFGTDYPFLVEVDHSEPVLRRPEQMSERQLLYSFLLVSSSLGQLEKRFESFFTYPFERLTALAVSSMFPNAEVQIFGTSDSSTTNLRDRVIELHKVLRGTIGNSVPLLADENSGDKGLDVLAHIDPGDPQEGRFVVFAQAACTDTWVTKQFAATPGAWRNVLALPVPQFNICAIPISFRDSRGEWHDLMDLSGGAMILDRGRLMKLVGGGLGDLEDAINGHDARRYVEALVSYQGPLL